jgi:hypothetical protein
MFCSGFGHAPHLPTFRAAKIEDVRRAEGDCHSRGVASATGWIRLARVHPTLVFHAPSWEAATVSGFIPMGEHNRTCARAHRAGAVRCRPVPDQPAEHVDCRRRGPMPHWDGLRSQRRPADRTPGLHDAYGSRAVWGSQCSSMSGTGRDTFGAGVCLLLSCGCRDSARASAVQFVRPSEGARPRVEADHGAQNRRGA